MGGPASGKSSIVGRIVKARDLVRSDPDDVKEQIPEYALAVQKCARNAAFMAHGESADVADRIAKRAVRERKNLVIDGTGKDLGNYVRTIRTLKKAGYHVTVVGASIPVEIALERAEKRGHVTGRFVPESVVRDIYRKVPCNISPIAQIADEFVLFDTLSKEPRPVMTKKRGKGVKIIDREYVAGLEKKCVLPGRQFSETLRGASKPSSGRGPALSLDELVSRVRAARRR
jgi:predicted ABC-type ATPase